MKKYEYKTAVFLITLAVFIVGCSAKKPEKEVIATIGKYAIYKEDLLFEAELYPPQYLRTITKEQLLDDLIQKKLLLLEAQRQGLDKEPNFLKMIERFWEQSLLRALLDKKSQEIRSLAKPDYTPQQETQLMQEWADGLKTNAKIKINKKNLDKIELK